MEQSTLIFCSIDGKLLSMDQENIQLNTDFSKICEDLLPLYNKTAATYTMVIVIHSKDIMVRIFHVHKSSFHTAARFLCFLCNLHFLHCSIFQEYKKM